MSSFLRILIGYMLTAALGALVMMLWLRQPVQRDVSQDFVVAEIKRVAKAVSAEEVIAFNYKHQRKDLISTTMLSVFGKARVFAGFDLNKHLVVSVDHPKKSIAIELGQPELLGVDVFQQTYQMEKDWPWNRFGEEDRDAVARGMRQGATETALKSRLFEEARESMKEFLTALLRGYGYKISVDFGGPQVAPLAKG